MRLFLSYARIDKPYCVQIADVLDTHDVWYDQRIYPGQNWWAEILRRIDWCEGFVYLLSPESVASEYCRKEFEIANNLGRPIFPVLIHKDTQSPAELKALPYVDCSEGLQPKSVKELLNSIYIAERQQRSVPPSKLETGTTYDSSDLDPTYGISEAAECMEQGRFDQALYLLKRIKETGYESRFVNLDQLIAVAEASLEKQTYTREAEREYRPIVELIKNKGTKNLGCQAFEAFRKDFPDFDPANLSKLCAGLSENTSYSIRMDHESKYPEYFTKERSTPLTSTSLIVNSNTQENMLGHLLIASLDLLAGDDDISMTNFDDALLDFSESIIDARIQKEELAHVEHPELEWCFIPAGKTSIEPENILDVDDFYISKYPITNSQYELFLNDDNGYCNSEWWAFSNKAIEWRQQEGCVASRFNGSDRPRESITWYDAMAFCNWLSARTGDTITLPLVQQWRRAAMGDEFYSYPWGNEFDLLKCNTRESKIRMTTPVNHYPNGMSPFGVIDMAGNVWEWCLDSPIQNEENAIDKESPRGILGGSFISDQTRCKFPFAFYLNPTYYYATIGFRVVNLSL